MAGRGVATLVVALALVAATVAPAGVGAAEAVAAGAGQATAPTEITECTTVTESGEYALAGDVNGSPTTPETGLGACVRIRADDVVLRGQGNALVGGERGGVVGVLVGGGERRANVTVRNLTATGWGAGVAAVDAADVAFRNVSAVGNLGDGFFLERAPNASVVGGTIRGSNTGVFLRNAPESRLAGLNVTGNIAGIEVRASDGTVVSGVEAGGNRAYGASLVESANATVADSTFRPDGFAGVGLVRVDGARVRNVTVAGGPASDDPIGVYLNDTDARLADVSVEEGTGWAVYAASGATAAGERVSAGDATVSFEARDVALAAAEDPPPLPTEQTSVGDPLVARPTSQNVRLSLGVHYADAAVARAGATEDRLGLWRVGADGDAGDWRRVETRVDARRNVAAGTIEEVGENGTVFALIGEGLAESSGNATG